ncbi:MAG: hypothetical protein N3H31_02035 [Candidatus Nezhaarchaeota archaeon]|nr:hypothetical protein [Candidatus Nezhaarchaeota archaeon]
MEVDVKAMERRRTYITLTVLEEPTPPGRGGKPSEGLLSLIEREFGSFEKFKREFFSGSYY